MDDSGSKQTARAEMPASLGVSERITLDRPSFEQVLSATSLIQQLTKNVQPRTPEPNDAEPLSDLVEAQLAIETGTIDLEAALTRVVGLAVKLNRATGAATWLFAGPEFVYRAGTGNGVSGDGLRQQVLSKLASICGPSDHSFYDPPESNDWAPAPDAIHYPGSAKSLLVAPIYHGRSIAGALAVFSAEFDAFAERDATQARLLSGLLTHALGKAAEAELKQKVSLERATMLQAIGQLMPALRMLAEEAKRESHGSPNQLPSAAPELDPGSELTTIQTQGIISSESGDSVLEDFQWAEALRIVVDGADLDPRVDPMGPQEEAQAQPDDAGDSKSPSASLGPEPIAARESAPIPARAIGAMLRRGVQAAAVRIQKNSPFDVMTGLSELAHRQSNELRFRLSIALEHTLGRLLRINTAAHRLRLPARFTSKVRALSAATVPAVVLLIVLALLLLRTGANQPFNAAAATSATIAAAKVSTVAVPFPRVQQRSGAVTAHPSSHMQVTDPAASSALRTLSRYEIAGLRRRAVYGDDGAAFLLGMAYETGHLVPQNCDKAGEWITKSANLGNAAAEYNLGLRYRQGDGEPANQEVAAQWLRKAAAQKYSQAQLALESVP